MSIICRLSAVQDDVLVATVYCYELVVAFYLAWVTCVSGSEFYVTAIVTECVAVAVAAKGVVLAVVAKDVAATEVT